MIYTIAISVGLIAIALRVMNIFDSSFIFGNKLNKNIVTLSPIKGKLLKDVISVVGTPSLINSADNGNKAYTWSEGWYAVTLLFNSENICIEIISQKLK